MIDSTSYAARLIAMSQIAPTWKAGLGRRTPRHLGRGHPAHRWSDEDDPAPGIHASWNPI
jgi:hypothetical protein